MATNFTSLVHTMVASGWNIWDARIEARKLLGTKIYYAESGRIRPQHYAEQYSPTLYPTDEDRLDVYFHSIIATCRSVVFGTAVPRTWYDIAGTWYVREDIHVRIRPLTLPKKSKYVPHPRPKVVKESSAVRKMTRLLVARGMDEQEAVTKSRILLGVNDESATA